jgi:predicted short-subunit dehydrogenase-like oxidoreductase (DUF2520 family)
MKQTAIIGLGKLGSHLYYALKRTGKYNVSPDIKHRTSKLEPEELKKCKTIFICTEDSAITAAADILKKLQINLKNKFIFHTSGALNSDLLLPLKKAGAFTGSFHPVQTFDSAARRYSGRFKGIFIAIEGNAECIKEGYRIAESLGSIPFTLNKESKILHHICCVFASNYLLSHISQMEKLSNNIAKAGLSKKIFINGFNNRSFFDIYKPLIEQTLINLKNKGLESSLTGPIERNDTVTVELHLNTLAKEQKDVLPFYILMGIEAIDIAVRKGSLNIDDANNLMQLMNRYM